MPLGNTPYGSQINQAEPFENLLTNSNLYTELTGSNISEADVVVAWYNGIQHVGIDNHDGTYTWKNSQEEQQTGTFAACFQNIDSSVDKRYFKFTF